MIDGLKIAIVHDCALFYDWRFWVNPDALSKCLTQFNFEFVSKSFFFSYLIFDRIFIFQIYL